MLKKIFIIVLILLSTAYSYGAVPNEFVDGTVADADDVNENFDYFENKFSTTSGHDHDNTDSKYLTVLGTLSGLTVSGTANFNGTTNINNDFTATGDLVVNETFTVKGVSSLSETNISNLTASQVVFTSATNDLVSVTAVTARSNLGLVIGTDVQAYDAQLADLADGTLSGASTVAANTALTGAVPVANGGTGTTTGWTATSGCYAYLSANQADLTADTENIINFNTESYDLASEWNTSTYLFTCAADGKYLVSANVSLFGVIANKVYQLLIIAGGTTHSIYVQSDGTGDLGACLTKVFSLSATNTIQIKVNPISAGANTVDVYGGAGESSISIMKL